MSFEETREDSKPLAATIIWVASTHYLTEGKEELLDLDYDEALVSIRYRSALKSEKEKTEEKKEQMVKNGRRR